MENIDELKEKVYSEKVISWATVVGSPLAGFHLISKNYKVFGNEKAARNSYYIGLIFTLIIIGALFLIPSNIIDIIPNQFIPLIYGALVYIYVDYFQNDAIKRYYASGGPKGSGWVATGIGLAYMVCFIIFVAVITFIMPTYDGEVKSFGVTNNQIYYDKDISESEIDEIGRALTAIKLFNDEYQTVVQLRVDGENKYRIIIPSLKTLWDDEQYLWEADNLKDILREFVPTKNFGVTLLHEDFSGSEYKQIN